MNAIKWFLVSLLFLLSISASAQYFGQNKVNYERFDFVKTYTPHFIIYNYLENDSVIKSISNQSEKWYLRHKAIFGDTITQNPIILYNNKADFKQTNVISGNIGVGTGGVTEGLRRRVIMPFMNSNKETNHVLGHEMVHVFQYFMIQQEDSLSYKNLQNLPLWMIEGLAEYLSIGPRHNQTAMWMRDAVMTDDVPTMKQMSKRPGEYFPYRYGHAFWSFVTGKWGDAIIRPYLYNIARRGLDRGTKQTLNISRDSLSSVWQSSVKETYTPFIQDSVPPVGEMPFGKEKYGDMNIAPVISPDGEHVAFLSNKDVISIDMLMANIETGEVVKELTGSVSQSHIDDYNYIESAGSWSPDGSKYVVTTFAKGRNYLLVMDISGDKVTEKEYKIKGVESFDNPEWSPKGDKIAFSGLKNGTSDLYVYDLSSGELQRLTNDRYSALQPAWSADGEKIVFISDRGEATDFDRQIYSNYRISEYHFEGDSVSVMHDLFPNANNYSPYYAHGDSSLYFLSHADGYRNLYRYDFHTDKVFQLSRFVTGISGITDLSPAFSLSRKTGKLAYTLYKDDGYHMYVSNVEDFEEKEVSKNLLNKVPEHLPPQERIMNVVQHNLDKHPQNSDSSITQTKYDPKLELEYIGSSGVGVSTGSYNTYGSGGVNAIFGDVLKRHQLYATLMMQGEIYDIGGGATYMNRESRLHWGGSFYHIPYRYSYYKLNNSFNNNNPGSIDSITIVQNRIFQDRLSVFGQYPFSKKLRLEAGGYLTRYGYRVDSIKNFYRDGFFLDRKEQKGDAPDPNYIHKVYTAFVGDDVDFGVTSPLEGYRFRIQLDQSFQDLQQFTTLVDLRKYYFNKPVGFGFRLMHYARYGQDAQNRYPLYLGNNYYIRGYHYNSFDQQNAQITENTLNPNSIAGSKMALINAEMRLPFTGPKRLSVIQSNFLYSDLVLFADGGFSTQSYDQINWNWQPRPDRYNVVYSAGVALRINLFGYAIVEPYIAHPFQRDDKEWVFGLFLKGMDW
ncbi:MAG: hypothetical protein K9I68_09835 [Bacteroidales bacterium]|nr:hypothetical protein [Bacteroidales bacterium]